MNWITQPHLPQIREVLEILLAMPSTQRTIQDRRDGTREYTIAFVDLESARPLVQRIEYVPLELSLELPPPITLDDLTTRKLIQQGVESILLSSWEVLSGVHCDTCITREYQNYTTFIPLLPEGPTYVSPDELLYLNRALNPSQYQGYTLLSSNPLIWYLKPQARMWMGMAIVPIDTPLETQRVTQRSLTQTQGIEIVSDHFVTRESTYLWGVKLIGDSGANKPHEMPNKLYVRGVSSSWMEQTIRYVLRGELPRAIVWGTWCVTDKDQRAKVWYASMLAYVDLAIQDPLLWPFVPTLRVLEDFSLCCVLSYSAQVNILIERIEAFWRSSATWQDKVYPDLRQALRRRRHVKRGLIVPLEDGYHLVIEDERSEIERSEIERSESEDEEDDEENKDTENIRDLTSLDLDGAHVEQSIWETLESLHPITGEPLSPKASMVLQYGLWGVYGLYEWRGFNGILKEIPSVPNVKPLYGKVKLRLIEDTLYQVEVVLPEGTVPMFKIHTKDPKYVRKIITNKWKEGYFLSMWCKAMILYASRMSLLVYEPRRYLEDAGMDLATSDRAIKFLAKS